MRTGSVSQCCRDGETTKCPFSMTLKNYCDQRTLGQQEQQGTDLKGSFQWYCAAFPQTHKPDSSCLLQRPQLLSSPFATVCTNWSPEYSHYSKTIWALREQNLRHHICTSKTSQPQHLQEQEREQTEQRWQWRRQLFFFFCTEGAPHQDLYQTIYRTGSLQFWAFIIPAQHQPGFTSPLPPLASLPSIQTKCQLNADVRLRAAGTEVLFSYFCFSPKVCIIHSNLNIQIAQITETDVSSTRWKTSVRKEKPVPFKCLEMLKSLLLFLNSHVPFSSSSLRYKTYWFRY